MVSLSGSFYLFLLTLLSFALIFSALGVWLLLKWRVRVKSGSFVSIPDEIFDRLDDSDKRIRSLQQDLDKYVKRSLAKQRDLSGFIGESLKEHKDELDNLHQQVGIFRKIAEEKGEELNRYKDGYDLTITKRLVLGVIRTIDDTDEYINTLENINESSPDSDSITDVEFLKTVKQQLINKLADEEIEPFIPDISVSLDDIEQSKRCEVIKTVPSPSQNQVGQIADIVNPGYRIVTSDDGNELIVRKANIVAYHAVSTKDKE